MFNDEIVAVGNDNIYFACDNYYKYNTKYINIVTVAETGSSIQPEHDDQLYKSSDITFNFSHFR